jgi:type I restriction enzyme S subunit
MELRAGYKQTEVGVIPEDWDVHNLGAFGKFRGGNGFPLRFQGNVFGEYPFFKVSDMNNDGNALFMQNSNHWITEKARKELGATAHPAGSIVFAKIGAAIFLERKKILIRDSCIDNNVMALVFNSPETDFRFFHYIFLTIELGKLVSATALPSLNGRDIAALRFGFPKAPEQRAIAAALSDADALITSLDALIAKKRDFKKAAMQQLLTGKKRLPGFTEEWEVKRLGDYVRFLKNGTLSRAQLSSDGFVKYLHYGDIHGAAGLRLNPRSTEMPTASLDVVKALDRLEDGDVVFVDASEDLDGVGKSIEITGANGIDIVAGLHTIAARFDKRVLADGFKAYLQFVPAFCDYLRSMAAGTKVLATNRKHIAGVEMALPSTAEQAAITEVLFDMDAELAALVAQVAKARTLKQGMMQELLTGRIRLV